MLESATIIVVEDNTAVRDILFDRTLGKVRFDPGNGDYQHHLKEGERQSRKIRASFFNAITALAYALEAKDSYTSGHSQKVSEISITLAQELGILQEYVEKIKLAAVVHDIGKIGIKEAVLNKPGSLTEGEYQQMKAHSEIGEHILQPLVEDKEILKIVRHHHERYDGGGYPDGVKGNQIPLGARIVAVADAYDAMISERPYRKAMSPEKAVIELERGTGSQFDPAVVGAFTRIRETTSPSTFW